MDKLNCVSQNSLPCTFPGTGWHHRNVCRCEGWREQQRPCSAGGHRILALLHLCTTVAEMPAQPSRAAYRPRSAPAQLHEEGNILQATCLREVGAVRDTWVRTALWGPSLTWGVALFHAKSRFPRCRAASLPGTKSCILSKLVSLATHHGLFLTCSVFLCIAPHFLTICLSADFSFLLA